MRRGGSRASLERLINRIRERVPGIAIRTTFITGFPGEREEDFEELMSFVRHAEFERVGVFTYSDEEGTEAYNLPDKVDARIARHRRARLMKEQARISRRLNKRRLGSQVRVLFEGESAESELLWQGRMESQAPEIDGCVLINDAPEDFNPAPGQLVRVEITAAHEYDLIGRII
jgi:ribosomal protein S12 methylthiotransferase